MYGGSEGGDDGRGDDDAYEEEEWYMKDDISQMNSCRTAPASSVGSTVVVECKCTAGVGVCGYRCH